MWFSAVANWTRKGGTFPQFIRESHERLCPLVLKSRPGVSVNEWLFWQVTPTTDQRIGNT
jgi:hypothetical protein